MIPKVDFQIHEVFIQAFLSKVFEWDRSLLDARFREFIDDFSSREEKILKLIEEYSGFSWTKEKIPVFLIPDSPALAFSFAKTKLTENLPGIVQKIRQNKHRDLSLFIHELSHINQYQSDFFSDKYKNANKDRSMHTDRVELSADIVTLYIIRNLFGENSEYEKDFWDFLENTSDRNKKKGDELKKHLVIWDLNKSPLEHYLSL